MDVFNSTKKGGMMAEITDLCTISLNTHTNAFIVSECPVPSSTVVRLESLHSHLIYVRRGSGIHIPTTHYYNIS